MRLTSTLILLGSVAFGGCGLVSDNFDGELSADFTVNNNDHTFVNELIVNPQDYKDVRDNCDRIKKETGQIREISIELSVQQNNHATYGSGLVFMRHNTELNQPWGSPIDGAMPGNPADPWPAELEALSVARFDRVPIVDGLVITTAIRPAMRRQIADLIFTEKCDQVIDIKMLGAADAGPVVFNGTVKFKVDFVATAG
ncbi:MAG: hypothetical protein U1E65_32060 [Myxococcota bacterium]